ncbi:hypothetical protein ACLE20_13180 [Rhizobium sp. YIM 134829]|uniref:hypothetical protein n=1 Tax=Rhizobium sp. YIM 134829 TaxID=3390453 RepID=UPI00397B5A7A
MTDHTPSPQPHVRGALGDLLATIQPLRKWLGTSLSYDERLRLHDTIEMARSVWESSKAAAPEPEERSYQDRVADAHYALFHDDPTDVAERIARFFEEAAETCQALGMTHDDASKLLAYTFSRPAGEPSKEIGSAKLTLASLCVLAGYDMDACGEADLEKLQRPETIARIRAKRATRHGRGPLPGLDPNLAATEGSADV